VSGFDTAMKQIVWAVLVAGAVILGGCATSREDGTSAAAGASNNSPTLSRAYDDASIARIKRGETREAQLLEWFGPPAMRSLNSEGRAQLAWRFSQGKLSVSLGPDGTVEAYSASH